MYYFELSLNTVLEIYLSKKPKYRLLGGDIFPTFHLINKSWLNLTDGDYNKITQNDTYKLEIF